jgi:exoribonuclease-2
MSITRQEGRSDLQRIAREAMQQHGMLPEFSEAVLAETERIAGATKQSAAEIRDLRHLLWASIDNDDSRDLDQLSVAEALPDDQTRVLVAIAMSTRLSRRVPLSTAMRARTQRPSTLPPDLPDAAGEAFDGPHVAERRAGALSDCG